jgi:Domain of unknown function (DUF4123)
MFDVQQRYQRLSERRRGLNWFALVDGYRHEQQTGEPIAALYGVNQALFVGTQDEPLAHAGPWLCDLTRCPEKVERIASLERAAPAVSWLIAPLDLGGLSQLLQLKLDAVLPGGKRALVRFYDPRVLGNLFAVMDEVQKATFFGLIDEWHFMYEGRRVWAGRQDA